MDRWDIFIILAAGYVSVMSLVRLMAARRNELIDSVREQLQNRAKRRAAAKKAEAEADRDVA